MALINYQTVAMPAVHEIINLINWKFRNRPYVHDPPWPSEKHSSIHCELNFIERRLYIKIRNDENLSNISFESYRSNLEPIFSLFQKG